jgi:hypothetical protein
MNNNQSEEIKSAYAVKIEFIFRHTDGTEIISAPYTISEILEKSKDDIREDACDCDCQPTGDATYKDCNCADYYDEFQLVGNRISLPKQ